MLEKLNKKNFWRSYFNFSGTSFVLGIIFFILLFSYLSFRERIQKEISDYLFCRNFTQMLLSPDLSDFAQTELENQDTTIKKKLVPFLVKALKKNKSQEIRLHSLTALKLIYKEAEEAIPALIETLKDKDPKIYGSAANILGLIGEPAKVAAPQLVKLLETPSFTTGLVHFALVKIGIENVIPELITLLRHSNKEVVYSAAELLSEELPKNEITPDVYFDLVPAFLDALQQGEERYSIIFLMNLGPEAKCAVPYIVKELQNSSDKRLRRFIISIFEQIGTEAKEAIPSLLEIIEKDESLKKEAQKALKKITGKK